MGQGSVLFLQVQFCARVHLVGELCAGLVLLLTDKWWPLVDFVSGPFKVRDNFGMILYLEETEIATGFVFCLKKLSHPTISAGGQKAPGTDWGGSLKMASGYLCS